MYSHISHLKSLLHHSASRPSIFLRAHQSRFPSLPPSQPARSFATPTAPREPPRRKKEDDEDGSSLPPAGGSSLSTTAASYASNPLVGAALTTVFGLGVVFVGGVVYFEWYKQRVLEKMEQAFAPGYDPALQLADHGVRSRSGNWDSEDAHFLPVDWATDIKRAEQEIIDDLVQGRKHGHYVLLLGPKGTGKTTMILDAMRRVQADGIAICEAHEDLEVFRLRLGKALNYEYNEDSQTGLFQRRDPREGGPRLDIERALNKMEKVALKLVPERKKLFQNNDESRLLLLQLQQKAESWAESHLVTVIFSTDDFWPYPMLRKPSNRMQVLSVSDLTRNDSLSALRNLRYSLRGEAEPDSVLEQVVDICGGRLSHVNHLAHSSDLLSAAKRLMENERSWLLSELGLIPDCDDDVMDEQKVCASSWLLLQEFVKRRGEPISYYEARQIMTRADFLEGLDRLNVIAIDVDHMVRPDSMVLYRAAEAVVNEEGFEELLTNVRDRIDEIESLHRTRELTWKEDKDKKSWWNVFT